MKSSTIFAIYSLIITLGVTALIFILTVARQVPINDFGMWIINGLLVCALWVQITLWYTVDTIEKQEHLDKDEHYWLIINEKTNAVIDTKKGLLEALRNCPPNAYLCREDKITKEEGIYHAKLF